MRAEEGDEKQLSRLKTAINIKLDMGSSLRHLAISSWATSRPSGSMSIASWMKQPAVMLVLLIALVIQADACFHSMNGIDVAWAWAWLLLPIAAGVEAVLRQVRVAIGAALAYWYQVPRGPSLLSVLRLRHAAALATPTSAPSHRARDSIP
jgi:hypothetical protein